MTKVRVVRQLRMMTSGDLRAVYSMEVILHRVPCTGESIFAGGEMLRIHSIIHTAGDVLVVVNSATDVSLSGQLLKAEAFTEWALHEELKKKGWDKYNLEEMERFVHFPNQ